LLKNRKTDEICGKLDCICDVANRYYENGSGMQSLQLVFGIYLPKVDGEGLREMQNNAVLARVNGPADRRYRFYEHESMEKADWERELAESLHRAQQMSELVVYFQPKVRLSDCRVVGAEALVRWFDPSIGDYRFPGDFISLFEANGFIIKLDHFIYLEVLKYMQAAAERGEKIVPVSVNVSRVTALQDNFIEFYVQNKRDHQIGDGFITLEITESFAMESDEKLLDIVNRLHENGIRCSIDDFGSGYSSYNTIKQIPIDEIKIDRIFLAKGLDQERDDKIIMSVVQLAKDLGVEVVQEGVETEAMFNRVVEMGCEVIQGYYYAKAIPIEEYRIFINSNTSIQFKKKVK
jgi:EAL domain-containing protein (putative c-di-GMP-specific phosphodiesterase class I)